MIKGIIFDMDGVVSDTQTLHANIEEVLLKKYGVEMTTDEITEKYAGIADREWFAMLIKDFALKTDIESITKEKHKNLLKVAKNNIKSIPGAIELIKGSKNYFKLALASASEFEFINLVLSELKIEDKFDVLTSASELEKGKPDPQIFLLTAQRLKLKPEECLVIEDGVNGMIAAKAAGMKCIGLVVVRDKSKYPADSLVISLKDINLEQIRDL